MELIIAIIVGIGWLLWQLIKWSWKWFFAPCFLVSLLVGVVIQVSNIFPIFGTLLHGGIVVFTFINMAGGSHSIVMSILIYAALPLALIDCINDLRITVKYKLHDDEALIAKYSCCAGLPAIATTVLYYMSDKSFQGVIQIFVTNYNFLLLLMVAPRALFIFAEINASIKVKGLIESNNFFAKHALPVLGSKYITLKQKAGLVFSNESNIKEEKKISSEKLEKMYPKKFLAKAAEIFAGDKETIDKRERAAKELADMENKVSYISKEGFQKFSAKAEELLRQVSSMSPRDFIEKKLSKEYNSWPNLGVEFFLIKAFASHVRRGIIKDESKDDYPMENHAYRHTESVAQVKVTNANKDPRLRLDDDD